VRARALGPHVRSRTARLVPPRRAQSLTCVKISYLLATWPGVRLCAPARVSRFHENARPENHPSLVSVRRHQLGVDYTTLRDLLKQGEWELADNEHRRLLTVLGGEDSEERGWVYFTEARQFPVTDLKTIDNLWTHFSDGRFGFSVQRKLWVGQRRQWAKFFKAIDWMDAEKNDAYRKWPEEFIWKKEAAKGHMPLTSALRGTQLLEALLEHPAFAPPAKPKSAAEQAADQLGDVQKNAEKALGNAMKGLKGLKKPSWMK